MGTNYQGGFAGGVTISEIPINLMASNKVKWVCSNTGSDGNDGSYDAPFATLDYAVSQCTASKGDIVVIKEYHTENITSATSTNIATAGVKVIGLGCGESMPVFTTTTTTAAKLSIDASGVLLKNVRVVAGVDGNTNLVDVNSPCRLEGVIVEGTNSYQPLAGIDVGGASANTCDETELVGCKVVLKSSGSANGLVFSKATDRSVIAGCTFDGNASTGMITCVAANNQTNLYVEDNKISNAHATGFGATLATSTGIFKQNTGVVVSAGNVAALVGLSMLYSENYFTSQGGIGAVLVKSGASV